jgi:hypothetical protein
MASAEPSRRVEKVVASTPLCEMSEQQRREFHEALGGRMRMPFAAMPSIDLAGPGGGEGRVSAPVRAVL